MKALWARFGRPGQKEPGKVSTRVHDRRTEGNAREASRRSQLRQRLLREVRRGPRGGRLRARCSPAPAWSCASARAGRAVRRPGAARRPAAARCACSGLVPWESPLYKAGVAQDDQLVNLDGTALTSMANSTRRWRGTSPAIACRCASCAAAARPSTPRSCSTRIRASRSCRWRRSAASLTDDQKRFRESWLSSQQK